MPSSTIKVSLCLEPGGRPRGLPLVPLGHGRPRGFPFLLCMALLVVPVLDPTPGGAGFHCCCVLKAYLLHVLPALRQAFRFIQVIKQSIVSLITQADTIAAIPPEVDHFGHFILDHDSYCCFFPVFFDELLRGFFIILSRMAITEKFFSNFSEFFIKRANKPIILDQ
jgi:hypothetical protein